MGFKKMARPKFPPRLWSLVGYPGSGKSSFASQMKGPMLVVDADHRFTEVMDMALGEVFQLSEKKVDNVDPAAITKLLSENMPGSNVQTIVVDSLTAIITPLVVQAMLDHDNGKAKNLVASFRTKALAMRQIQDSITRWGSDVLWIYHLQDSRDGRANEVTRATISQTELARLTRSINLQLRVLVEGERRGVVVDWARRGRSGVTLWDDTGCWKGMPERIEEAIYEGLSKEEQDAIEKENPDYFPNPETAINWAVEKGAYATPEKARQGYAQVRDELKPANAREMATLWVESVEATLAARIVEARLSDEGGEAKGKKRKAGPEVEPTATMEDAVF